MEDLLLVFVALYVMRIVLKAIWAFFSANDYRRDW
jgi:hypothetical protein